MWKNRVEPERSQMTVWGMCVSRWVPKATDPHSEYVILIAFPLQQWLHERASMLRYNTLPVLLICYVSRQTDRQTDRKACQS
jgi:hypothetical protein